jgi:hypothetical protein
MSETTRINGVLARRVKARKSYECESCPAEIAEGDHYWYVAAFWPYRVCSSCGVRGGR